MDYEFLRDNWTEFDWEKELRKDDGRIRAYCALLPRFIDLPEEDPQILHEIQKDPALRLSDGDLELLCPLPYAMPEEDEDGEEEPSSLPPDDPAWESAEAAAVYKKASVLARDFAVFSAESMHLEEKEALTILCMYGKLLSRSNEYIDMELSLRDPEEEHPPVPLLIACCKRMLSEVNDLLGAFIPIGKRGNAFQNLAEKHTGGLLSIRDDVMKMLLKLRDAAS